MLGFVNKEKHLQTKRQSHPMVIIAFAPELNICVARTMRLRFVYSGANDTFVDGATRSVKTGKQQQTSFVLFA